MFRFLLKTSGIVRFFELRLISVRSTSIPRRWTGQIMPKTDNRVKGDFQVSPKANA
jgi:hypothetical protein